jgi:hypothetical protein
MAYVTTADVVRAGMSAGLRDVHTAMPGIVRRWNPEARTVDVEPVPREVLLNSKGERVETPYPIIPGVPLATLRGGGYVVAFPVAVGDAVWLQFSEASFAEWRVTGQLQDQLDTQRHPLSYPIAIPMLETDVKPLASGTVAENALVIGLDGETNQIQISPDGIKLGKDASHPVAKGDAVKDALDAISTFLQACAGAAVVTAINGPAGVAKGLVDAAKAQVESSITKTE